MQISEETQSYISKYHQIRKQTLSLIEPLSIEDMVVQSMADASPTKWHLGHTTWFFETFLLRPHYAGYRIYNPHFQQLFNSYYDSVGDRHPRIQRGLLTRPGLQEVLDYRSYVDEHIATLLQRQNVQLNAIVKVGLHHEMQHQELLLTDILHLFSANPLAPELFHAAPAKAVGKPKMFTMEKFAGGLVDVGDDGRRFSYDCEQPVHKTYISPYALSSRVITQGEWLEFMQDQGYQNKLIWLSDGWDLCCQHQWQSPLYWRRVDGEWHDFGLCGLQPINKTAPVCHISYFEADAFARWAQKRLPREHELELCCQTQNIQGNFLENRHWQPLPTVESESIAQIYGDVWEWTQSAFLPYPNFRPSSGALGEYNGKFMMNQMVLKGGSCVTPKEQMRASYRNFFYPHQRWQFSGLRLADDLT